MGGSATSRPSPSATGTRRLEERLRRSRHRAQCGARRLVQRSTRALRRGSASSWCSRSGRRSRSSTRIGARAAAAIEERPSARPICCSRRPIVRGSASCWKASIPGGSSSRHRASTSIASHAAGSGTGPPLIVSPGRLVWEKGHFDVLRALAAADADARLLIVGSGPERDRLLRYAAELGLADRVDDPRRCRTRRCRACSRRPRASCWRACRSRTGRSSSGWFWRRRWQPACLSSRARPEPSRKCSRAPGRAVRTGRLAFSLGVARQVPHASELGARVAYPAEIVERYSTRAAAERLASAYQRVLAEP